MYRHKLIDQAALKFLRQGINVEDSRFVQIYQTSVTLHQMLSQRNAKYKLLQLNENTHIGFGLIKTGINQDVYQIGILLFKSAVSIEKILERSQFERSVIIVGRVLSEDQKPGFAVINRGRATQIIIGPNRFHYDPLNGNDFRIFIPNNYFGVQSHPIFDEQQPTIEIYTTPINNSLIKNATNLVQTNQAILINQDVQQNLDPFKFPYQDQIEIQNFTFMVPQIDSKNTGDISLEEAFFKSDLLKILFPAKTQNSTINRQVNQSNISRPQNHIGQTRTQMIRENAAKSKQIQPLEVSMVSAGTINNNASPKFYQGQRSQLNNTFGNGQFQSQIKPPQVINSFQNYSNEQMSCVNSSSIPKFQFNQTQSQGFIINSQQNQINWPQNNSKTQQQSFQNHFNQNVFQNNNNSIQSKQIAQTVYPLHPTQIPKFEFANNTSKQTQFQFQSQVQPQQQQQQRTPLPTRYNVHGTESKQLIMQQQQQQQQQQFIQQQPPINLQIQQPFPYVNQNIINEVQINQTPQNQTEFSRLHLTDQQLLKGYLDELSRHLSVHELKQAEEYMLLKPELFYQLYKQTKEEIQQFGRQNKEMTEIDKQKAYQQETETLQISNLELNDISLFLLNVFTDQFQCSTYVKNLKGNLEKLLQGTDKQILLTNIVLRLAIPRNDSFVQMYRQLNTADQGYDLTFVLRGRSFKCHKIVFQRNDYLQEAMETQNQECKKQYGKKRLSNEFDLPDWIEPAAFKLFIQFYYTGGIEFKPISQVSQSDEILELLKVACYFFSARMQELIIAQEIIPNMTAASALKFLKYVLEGSNVKDRPIKERPRQFLLDYCLYYISKNLAQTLRTQDKLFSQLEFNDQYHIARKAFEYMTDVQSELDIILKYAATNWTYGSMLSLFEMAHDRVSECCGFEIQKIQQIAEITEVDPSLVHVSKILKGYDYEAIKPIKRRNRDSSVFNDSKEEDIVVQQQNSSNSLKQKKPSENVDFQNDGSANTNHLTDEDATFIWVVNLLEKDIHNRIQKEEDGITIMSRAFDVGRRSFHLKLDYCKQNQSLSVWIVERGKQIPQKDSDMKLQIVNLTNKVPIKFSSIKAEIEIADPGLKNRKTTFFFTFAHDTHQIVGHKDFAKLEQMTNQDSFKIRVRMSEHIVHSALMHYFASDFQNRFKEELQSIDIQKNKIADGLIMPSRQQQNNSIVLLKLPLESVFSLLQSDDIKVCDENTVLSFIYHYTNEVIQNKQSLEKAVLAANMLSQCLRFNFLSFYNLMSAIRKSEAIQLSEIFVDSFTQEYYLRQKMGKIDITSQQFKMRYEDFLNYPFCGGQRKYFSRLKIDLQGRNKLLLSEKGVYVAMLEELMEWALKSKTESQFTTQKQIYRGQNNHMNSNDSQTRQLKEQLYEERVEKNRLAEQLQQLSLKFHQMSDQNKPQKDKNVPLYSPPQYVPNKQNLQKENLNPYDQAAKQNQKKPSDQSYDRVFNDTLNLSVIPNDIQMNRPPSITNPMKRAPPAGISLTNNSQDLSAIMTKINSKPHQNLTRNLLNGKKKNGNECNLF